MEFIREFYTFVWYFLDISVVAPTKFHEQLIWKSFWQFCRKFHWTSVENFFATILTNSFLLFQKIFGNYSNYIFLGGILQNILRLFRQFVCLTFVATHLNTSPTINLGLLFNILWAILREFVEVILQYCKIRFFFYNSFIFIGSSGILLGNVIRYSIEISSATRSTISENSFENFFRIRDLI